MDCKQCRAKLIFVLDVQSGTLWATLRSTGVHLLKNITFLYVFGAIRWSHRLGGDGGMGAGAYRLCHSSRAGVSCTLRLQPVAVGSGQWGRSQKRNPAAPQLDVLP